ncbi:MAG: putative metal-binding motif-containing protein, partial [Myxococcota bacterium]
MVLILALLVPTSLAAGAGQTGASAGCGSCHGDTTSAAVTVTLGSTLTVAAPGDTLAFTLDVAGDGVAGLNVATTGGTFGAGANTQVLGGELTHTEPVALRRGVARFAFTWTAPAEEGTYRVSAAGLAADDDGTALGDGWATATDLVVTVSTGCADLDGDGYDSCGADCDDADPAVSPAGVETCDGVDQDCDGAVDDDATDALTFYADADGDGYGDVTRRLAACELPVGYATVDGDCDDADAAYNPGALEPDCTDPADYNCDGATGYDDNDGDGWSACLDCNDGASAVHPGTHERCNDVDDDCDGDTDEDDAEDVRTWYDDDDGDGYGDPEDPDVDCDRPSGHVSNDDDCDDEHGDAFPGATEVWYDGVDQDCDGQDDDRDGDGHGVARDCDDLDPTAYPGAPNDAWYDGVDTDCVGNSDFDQDGDGYDSASFGGNDCDDGNAATWPGAPEDPSDGLVNDCNQAGEHDADGDGHAALDWGGDDCDDANSSIHPEAQEAWYDGVDQDCDGVDNDQDGDGVPFERDCDDTDPVVGDCYDDEEPPPEAPPVESLLPDAEAVGCGCAAGGAG